MPGEKLLSDLYQMYNKGAMQKKDIEGRMFRYLLENSDRYNLFDGNRDRWEEFLSWLYPRFTRAIDLYRDTGSSFDAYITGLVHCAAREYRCREAEHYLTEFVCWKARAEEMELFESECEYPESRKEVFIPGGINPRQVLFLLLKSYFFVSDEFVKKAAGIIGMKSEAIRNLIDELRKQRSGQEAKILDMRERVHCQHYRCLAYQKRMSTALPGTEYHERMKDRFERARKRFDTMKKRLERMRMAASNRMIADLLGIPKGTVDSGLFSIKSYLASF